MNVEKARKKADEWFEKNPKEQPEMRSCWKCNGAHDHLKQREWPLVCFSCGKWYYKGIDITEN